MISPSSIRRDIYIIRLLNDYFQWFWLWCGCLLRSVFFKSWLEILLLLFETLFFFYFFGWSCMWTIHERKHLLRLYYNLRDSPQTLAQPMNWKCSLLFIIGQLLLLTLHSFLFRNSKKNTHLIGSIKINYFVISKIMVWFSSTKVLRKKRHERKHWTHF